MELWQLYRADPVVHLQPFNVSLECHLYPSVIPHPFSQALHFKPLFGEHFKDVPDYGSSSL